MIFGNLGYDDFFFEKMMMVISFFFFFENEWAMGECP